MDRIMSDVRTELREDIMEIAQLLRGLEDKVAERRSELGGREDRQRLTVLLAQVKSAAAAFDQVAI